jgi:GDPmannose 4,6-dehydratase
VWQGAGVDERGVDARTGTTRVRIDPRYFRPTEVDYLLGDPSKAHRLLGWRHQTTFAELVREMVQVDLALGASGQSVVGPGGVGRRLYEVGD